MFSTGEEAAVIVERKGFSQVSDEKQIEEYVQKVLDENLEKVEEFKSGKDKLLGFFVGQVMKLTGGKANPQMVNKILRDLLSK